MGVDLRSDVLWAHYGVPSYRRWLADCDMRSAYAWHRRILQVLQHHFPPRRWVTKWPTHVSHLPVLLETYRTRWSSSAIAIRWRCSARSPA